MHSRDDAWVEHGAPRVYAWYAVATLAATVLVGAWLRAALAWPAVGLGLPLGNALHAHSHVGFFGWAVLAPAALLARRLHAGATRRGLLRAHAHALGILSFAALAAFAWQGYGAISIALSALHVLLWVALAALAWPLDRANRAERAILRGALAMLVTAGAATLVPGILMARGVGDGWLRETGIKLFLAAFINGWLVLAVAGALAARHERPSRLRLPALLVAAGALPSALLYVAAAPPAAWLQLVGRGGALAGGLGLLLLGMRLAGGDGALRRGGALAAALAGVLAMLAGAGVGQELMHGRAIVVAYLHLVLLGFATPLLLVSLAPARLAAPAARAIALVMLGGLAAMLAALVVQGWPRLTILAYPVLGARGAAVLAFAGGAVAAAAAMALGVLTLGARPVAGHGEGAAHAGRERAVARRYAAS